jgi:hypothetical protein
MGSVIAVVAFLILAFGSGTALAGRAESGGPGLTQPVTMTHGVAPEPEQPERRLDADDGEDHFDEGDDEFGGDGDESDGSGDPHGGSEAGCRDYDDGEDRCLDGRDDGEDRFDAGDDEASCDNYNDGEDRCEDNPDDRLDPGDDEFDVSCSTGSTAVGTPDDGEDHVDEGDDEFGQAGPCALDAFDEDLDAGAIDATGVVLSSPIASTLPAAAASDSAEGTLPIAALGLGAISVAGVLLARRRLGA